MRPSCIAQSNGRAMDAPLPSLSEEKRQVMAFRKRSGMIAVLSALLILGSSQLAGAGDKGDDASIWQDSDKKIKGNSHGQGKAPVAGRLPVKPWVDKGPADDAPVAPVPEPGTMALASLGLLSLAAALRKRRAGRISANGPKH
jgi:hypothetical protein